MQKRHADLATGWASEENLFKYKRQDIVSTECHTSQASPTERCCCTRGSGGVLGVWTPSDALEMLMAMCGGTEDAVAFSFELLSNSMKPQHFVQTVYPKKNGCTVFVKLLVGPDYLVLLCMVLLLLPFTSRCSP